MYPKLDCNHECYCDVATYFLFCVKFMQILVKWKKHLDEFMNHYMRLHSFIQRKSFSSSSLCHIQQQPLHPVYLSLRCFLFVTIVVHFDMQICIYLAYLIRTTHFYDNLWHFGKNCVSQDGVNLCMEGDMMKMKDILVIFGCERWWRSRKKIRNTKQKWAFLGLVSS